MKYTTYLILTGITLILILALNLGCLYGIYKCFSTGNYPLGVVLTLVYLGWKIADSRSEK